MKTRITACALLWLFLLVPALGLAGDVPARMDMAGLSRFVSGHVGQVVVVNFFATWCPPCREEIPHLIRIAQTYGGKAAVVGVRVDEDAAAVPPFVAKMGIPYAVRMASPELAASFGVRSIPHNVVYGPDGVMRANQPGYVDGASLKAFIDDLLERK